jgi:hypothetical protein
MFSPAAVAFGQTVNGPVKDKGKDDEAEGEKLAGKPEMKRELEEGVAGKGAAPLGGLGQQVDQTLEAKGKGSPGGKDNKDELYLVAHVPLARAKQVDVTPLFFVSHVAHLRQDLLCR